MKILLQGPLTILGRILIATIFLMSAVGDKIPKFGEVTKSMATEGVPQPRIMLAGAIAFLIAGSLSIMVGYRTRIGATLLLVFLLLATYFYLDFWTLAGAEREEQMIQFMKNLALMGTMVFLIANGPGPLSLDGRSAARKDK